MKVLGVDVGYGDVKVVYGNETEITNIFKFPSVVGLIQTSELVKDDRVYKLEGNSYYVGDNALKLESSSIFDVTDYSNLETFTPIFLAKILSTIEAVPDVITAGLSIAQIGQSAYYRERIKSFFVNEMKVQIANVNVIPQGIGAKLAFDTYGDNFPTKTTDFTGTMNYIGCDIGFNTLDVFQVIEGKTTPNLIKGLENQGIVRIVSDLQTYCKDVHKQTLSIKEAKDAMDKGFYRRRGKEYSVSDHVEGLKINYLKYLEQLIEDNFGRIIDKVDYIGLFGGGALVFRDKSSSFYRVPTQNSEYYNAIGNYIYGCKTNK